MCILVMVTPSCRSQINRFHRSITTVTVESSPLYMHKLVLILKKKHNGTLKFTYIDDLPRCSFPCMSTLLLLKSPKMTVQQPHANLHLEQFHTVSQSPHSEPKSPSKSPSPSGSAAHHIGVYSILLDFGESDSMLVNCSGSYGILVDIRRLLWYWRVYRQ